MTYDIERLENTPTPTEVENIAELCDVLTGQATPRDIVEENVAEIVENPSQLLFVARDAGRIIGMTLLTLKTTPHERTAYGDSSVVHPDYRRRGIAKDIWEHVRDFVDTKGIVLQGATSPKRKEAWQLYQQIGYREWDSRFIVRKPRDVK